MKKSHEHKNKLTLNDLLYNQGGSKALLEKLKQYDIKKVLVAWETTDIESCLEMIKTQSRPDPFFERQLEANHELVKLSMCPQEQVVERWTMSSRTGQLKLSKEEFIQMLSGIKETVEQKLAWQQIEKIYVPILEQALVERNNLYENTHQSQPSM